MQFKEGVARGHLACKSCRGPCPSMNGRISAFTACQIVNLKDTRTSEIPYETNCTFPEFIRVAQTGFYRR